MDAARGECALTIVPLASARASSRVPVDKVALWHRRLGHVGLDQLPALTAALPPGERVLAGDVATSRASWWCEACAAAKARRAPFPPSASPVAPWPLHTIHADVVDGLPASDDGYRFALIATDEATRYTWAMPLRRKGDASSALAQLLREESARLSPGAGRPSVVRTDDGAEFRGELATYCAAAGIRRQTTVPDSSPSNGLAERANGVVQEKMRTLLKSANLEIDFWPEALRAAAFFKNRVQTRALGAPTPFERLRGRPPSLRYARAFGCRALLTLLPSHRRKDDVSRAVVGRLVGYDDEESKGYLFYVEDGAHSRTVWRRDVVWDERPADDRSPGDPHGGTPLSEASDIGDGAEDGERDSGDPGGSFGGSPGASPGGSSGGSHGYRAEDSRSESPDALDLLSRPTTLRGHSVRLDESLHHPQRRPRGRAARTQAPSPLARTTSDGVPLAPASLREAMRTPEWLLWQEAMKAELRTLEDRGVVEWGVLPPGKRAIGNVWNFRVKTTADGSFQKRKARLCAQGFSQRPGEFGDVFAPTADLSTVRTALVIAQQMDMKLYQFDISAAYLHADLEEEVWMRPPAGIQGSPPGLACRLRKALYGLRQAGRAWADHFARILKGLGFHRFVSDGVVFRRTQKDSDIILVIFTDDVLAASSSHAAYLDLLAELRSHLELVDNGPYHFFLGNEYIQRDGRSYISQEGYVEALLARHGMSAANPSSLPYGTEQLTARSDAEGQAGDEEKKAYQEIVGELLWLARNTRPDIAQRVAALGQYSANPAPRHQAYAKRVLRYLRGTSTACLQVSPASSVPLEVWVDADYANCPESRRSVTGIAVYCFGALVEWKSKKQPTVALSTMEAEYAALSESVRVAYGLRNLLLEAGVISPDFTIPVYCDSACAVAIFSRVGSHGRLKHVDVRLHHVREKSEAKEIRVVKVAGITNRADLLTKPLPRDAFERAREMLGVHTGPPAAPTAGGRDLPHGGKSITAPAPGVRVGVSLLGMAEPEPRPPEAPADGCPRGASGATDYSVQSNLLPSAKVTNDNLDPYLPSLAIVDAY